MVTYEPESEHHQLLQLLLTYRLGRLPISEKDSLPARQRKWFDEGTIYTDLKRHDLVYTDHKHEGGYFAIKDSGRDACEALDRGESFSVERRF